MNRNFSVGRGRGPLLPHLREVRESELRASVNVVETAGHDDDKGKKVVGGTSTILSVTCSLIGKDESGQGSSKLAYHAQFKDRVPVECSSKRGRSIGECRLP